jgi:hypothetical protein
MTAHPKPKKPPWRIDPSIDVNRVSLADVRLIFSQAEKRLADMVRIGQSIESKTMTIFSLMAGVLIALCGYIISNWNNDEPISNKTWVAILGVIYIPGLSIYMLPNLLTDRYFMQGSKPSQLMSPSYFATEIHPDKITLFLFMSEIENYNLRIEENLKENDRNLRLFRLFMTLLLILPIFPGIAFGIMQWLY